MAHFSVIAEQNAEPQVQRVFAEIRRDKRLPFVPNFFKTLAHAPHALEATWMVYRGISTCGSLPESIKEMIFVAISAARKCKYCEAAHLAFCNLLDVDPGNFLALIKDIDSVRPHRIREILRFSVKCAMEPQNVELSDYDKLRQHGITDSEIVETVAMCGFAMYATTVSDVLRLDIDTEVTSILAPWQVAAS